MVFSFWWSKPNWSMKHWLIITLFDFSMTLDYWDSLLTQELLTTKLVELFTNSLTTILMGDCLLIHIISDQGMLNDINLDKLMLFSININFMSFSVLEAGGKSKKSTCHFQVKLLVFFPYCKRSWNGNQFYTFGTLGSPWEASKMLFSC